MSKASIEIGGIRIGSQSNSESPTKYQTERGQDVAFHALILGNFSGTNMASPHPKPRLIDRDNFDDVLSSLSPTLTLFPTGDKQNPIELQFNELEDFEPDHLFNSLAIFSELRSLRRKLSNNSSFESAAKEVKKWSHKADKDISTTKTNKQTANRTQGNKTTENKNLLDTLLSETAYRQQENTLHAGDKLANSLIQQIVAPFVIPGTHPEQAELIRTIDDAISGLMNMLLHNPEFQSLEASWRSLYATVRRIKTSSKLKLYMADIDKAALANDLNHDDLTNSTVHQNLIGPFTDIPGAVPWAVIVGDYYFGDHTTDILLLERMGLLAQHCNAAFVSAAKPEIVNCDDIAVNQHVENWTSPREKHFVQAWNILRESSQARNIALTFPRTLTRLPYGSNTKTIEGFSFEEMENSNHNNYLWGNSAYSVLRLLAEAFAENGWDFLPGKNNEIRHLPAHSFKQDGELELKPCAEIYLTEKAGEKVLENGLLPVWSILRSDSVRVGPFSSLHSGNQHIQGKWR